MSKASLNISEHVFLVLDTVLIQSVANWNNPKIVRRRRQAGTTRIEIQFCWHFTLWLSSLLAQLRLA
jgi:hypothetical protein